MDEWTSIAFGAFALSSFVSALRIGQWILHAEPRAIINAGRWSLALIYPVHVTTRKSLGDMTRKLSVTELRSCAQLRGTFSRRNSSVASANWVHVA